MQAWLLKRKAPKGVSKQQALQAAGDPASLALCGILSSDYSAQRLPGAKFYRPLGSLVPAVAGGMRYAAVTKADVVKGVPAKDWNTGTAAAVPGVQAAGSSSSNGTAAAAESASSKATPSTKKTGKKQKVLDDDNSADQRISLHRSSSSSESSRRSTIAHGSDAAGAPAAANNSSSSRRDDALERGLLAPSPVDDWEALATAGVMPEPWPVQPQQQQHQHQQQQPPSRSHPPAEWAPEAAAGNRQQGQAANAHPAAAAAAAAAEHDDDDDVPEGFGLPRISTSSNSSRLERRSSGTPTYAASTCAAAARAAPVVGMSAAAAAANAAFSTVRLVDAALLNEEQQRQRFVRVLDLMQPAFEPLLVTFDEQQLQVLVRIEEADLAALLQQPQAERRLTAFVNQVARREQQLAPSTAGTADAAAAAVFALDKGGARYCIRPQQLLPEHAEALAAEFPG
jgi:hypothetical protein